MHSARLPFLLLLSSFALGCGRHGAAPPGQEHGTHMAGRGAACTARVADSSMVSVAGGYDVYIEANTFTPAADGSYLLAGMPNYVSPPSPGHTMVYPARDSIFGAVRSPDGRWSLVPLPAPVRRLRGARANAIGEGRWEVTFMQLAEQAREDEGERSLDAWYGVVTANGWEHFERIPVPDGMVADFRNPTHLMRTGDTLTWAFRITRPNEYWLAPVGVVQRIGPRRRGQWKFHLIDLETTAVSGYPSPDGEPRVIVEHSSHISLGEMQGVRFALAPDPVVVDTVMAPTHLNRYRRQVDATPDGTWSLTWQPERLDSVMRRISITLGPDHEVPASKTVTGFYPSVNRVEGSQTDDAWMFVADARDRHNNGHLEFLRVTADTQVSLASLPHRYIGPITLAQPTSKLLKYTGPVFVRDSSEARIASLLTTVDFACRD